MPTLLSRCTATLAALSLALAPAAHASAYDAKPKLVVILVIDQFRGDYLDRYRADFKTRNGFRLFLDRGAYFPNTYYDYANTETAPGHSTIGTGAYSDGHNIGVNQWWDLSRSTTHQVSSVEDPEYPLVGASTDAALGASPRNELASTLADEVVISTGGKARAYGVSLKDRAAILTSGHATTGAFWLDHATGHWISSTYWGPKVPAWVDAFNQGGHIEQARREAGVPDGEFYEKVGAKPAAVKYQLDFAESLIEGEKLGHDGQTDVLTISLSSTDILGHQVGPDAPEQRALIGAMDTDLDAFFSWLDGHVDGGLGNVWVSLTGDHGVAPRPSVAAAEGIPAAVFNNAALDNELDSRLNAKFSPGQTRKFVLGGTLPYLQLDAAAFAPLHVSEADAENAAADLLPGAMEAIEAPARAESAGKARILRPATIRQVTTKWRLTHGEAPDTEMGRILLHSAWTGGGWWLLVAPGMYQMAGTATVGTNHFTPYSYDRHVPMAFFGSPFVPGTYLGKSAPVDIAATFAALLRVNQPSACVGRVVTEALRPEPATVSPAEAR